VTAAVKIGGSTMTMTIGRCIAMSVGAALLAIALLAAGVPGAVLLAVAPVLVCVAMHLVMGHGDPDGERLLETARRAARPPRE
jgi:hypothetical protein